MRGTCQPSKPRRFVRSDVWPTPELELLLEAGLRRGPEAFAAWNEWKRRRTHERVDNVSSELLPLVYWNLRDVARGDETLQALRSTYLVAWGKHAIRSQRLATIALSRAPEKIPLIVLKGMALALQFYPDPATRVTGDIDILVRREDADRALQILAEQGWLPDGGRKRGLLQAMQVAHGLHLTGPDEDSLDLHWKIFLGAVEDKAYTGFWDRAVPILHTGSGTLQALGPADQLLHTCVHGLKRHVMPSCRWVADLVTITDTAGSALDWNQLVHSAQDHKVEIRVGQALSYAADRFGVSIPEKIQRALSMKDSSWGSRLELAIVTRPPYVLGPVSAVAKAIVLYRRSGARAGNVSHAVGLVQYLQGRWALRSPWLVPLFGIREILRAVWRGLKHLWNGVVFRRSRRREQS